MGKTEGDRKSVVCSSTKIEWVRGVQGVSGGKSGQGGQMDALMGCGLQGRKEGRCSVEKKCNGLVDSGINGQRTVIMAKEGAVNTVWSRGPRIAWKKEKNRLA